MIKIRLTFELDCQSVWFRGVKEPTHLIIDGNKMYVRDKVWGIWYQNSLNLGEVKMVDRRLSTKKIPSH